MTETRVLCAGAQHCRAEVTEASRTQSGRSFAVHQLQKSACICTWVPCHKLVPGHARRRTLASPRWPAVSSPAYHLELHAISRSGVACISHVSKDLGRADCAFLRIPTCGQHISELHFLKRCRRSLVHLRPPTANAGNCRKLCAQQLPQTSPPDAYREGQRVQGSVRHVSVQRRFRLQRCSHFTSASRRPLMGRAASLLRQAAICV